MSDVNRRVPDCMGGEGEQGERGERGEKGERGERGKRGRRGHHGHRGDTGPTGPTGYTGPTGPTGFTGPTGPTGFTGSAGEPGQPGPTGPGNEFGKILKFSGAVTGLNNQIITYYLPDAGNTRAENVLQNSPPTDRLEYPMAVGGVLTAMAASITILVPNNGSVVFSLLVNNVTLVAQVIFLPGEGGGSAPKLTNFPDFPFSALDRITVRVVVNDFEAGSQRAFIAAATVALQ